MGATSFPASAIVSGVLSPARLGAGTPSDANFLRGDGSWQAIPTPTKESIGLGNVENAAASALYVALTGNQSITGTKTFTGSIVSPTIQFSSDGPMFRRAATTIEARTAANDAYAPLRVASLTIDQASIVGREFVSPGPAFALGTTAFSWYGAPAQRNFIGVDGTGNLWIGSGNSSGLLLAPGNGSVEQRNGLSAQALRLYNTFTDANNYERGVFRWTSNTLTIGTEHAGTGVARGLNILFSQATRPGRIYTTDPFSGNLYLTSENGITVERGLTLSSCNIQSNESFTVGPINNNSNLSLRRSGTGNVIFVSLPTANPGVAGAIWRDGNDLKIS